jgi:hypothetical protein
MPGNQAIDRASSGAVVGAKNEPFSLDIELFV